MLLAILAVSCLVLTACHSCEFGEGAVIIHATCAENGLMVRVCECGESKTEIIPAGHNYTSVVTNPTCLGQQGFTTHTCVKCGDSYVDTYVEAYNETAHNFQQSDACEYCGQSIVDVAEDSFDMSATADDNVMGYIVCRRDGQYDVYIKGTGAMKNYTGDPIYNDRIFGTGGYKPVNVYIREGVTSIGTCAFDGCESLISVVIPGSVITIGEGAFYNCTSLESVTIGEGVTSIGTCAFYFCTSLTSIDIPNSVTSISDHAFGYCRSLTSIDISDSLTTIDEYAFNDCTSLTSIVIPESVNSIGEGAFHNCRGLTSVTFEDPNGWYVSRSLTATSGTGLTLTNTSTNATYFTLTYVDYWWYKK